MCKYRVLIVDDEPVMRAAMVSVLNRVGISARAVASAQEAENVLIDDPNIEVMVCDYQLDMTDDGLRFTERITTVLPDLRAIMITGDYGDRDEFRRIAQSHGATDVLFKAEVDFSSNLTEMVLDYLTLA